MGWGGDLLGVRLVVGTQWMLQEETDPTLYKSPEYCCTAALDR